MRLGRVQGGEAIEDPGDVGRPGPGPGRCWAHALDVEEAAMVFDLLDAEEPGREALRNGALEAPVHGGFARGVPLQRLYNEDRRAPHALVIEARPHERQGGREPSPERPASYAELRDGLVIEVAEKFGHVAVLEAGRHRSTSFLPSGVNEGWGWPAHQSTLHLEIFPIPCRSMALEIHSILAR
jgi:hypothetical protein